MMTGAPPTDPAENEALLRRYASGTLSWNTLRASGFESFADVLAGLGALGLRQPMAEMIGPNVESRMRGRAMLRQILADLKR
jgi:hypothetical protein